MKKQKQLFLPEFSNAQNAFGGSSLQGKRKVARPIAIKSPMHIVIKANSPIFLKYLKKYKNCVQRFAKKFHVKIYRAAFNGNHVHIVLRAFSREAYRSFIRAITGAIAQISSKTEITSKSKIFLHRPFTRIVAWGRDFRKILSYLHLNEMESDGISRETGRLLISLWDST